MKVVVYRRNSNIETDCMVLYFDHIRGFASVPFIKLCSFQANAK